MSLLINKTCTRCNKTYPISFFYRNKQYKDGYMNICKVCKRLQGNEFNVEEYYEHNGTLYKKQYKGVIRDNDEPTRDIREMFDRPIKGIIKYYRKEVDK